MKVWMTRDEGESGPLSTALREAGLEVVHEPVLQRYVVYDACDEIAALKLNDWLVLTSAYAVRAIGDPPQVICKVAVVGAATKKAAEDRGLRVDYISEGGDAKHLFEELAPLLPRRTVCYPRSSQAAEPELGKGVRLVSPVIYETKPRAYRRQVVDEIDVIAVASPSAVKAIGKQDKPFASIGPTTSGAVRELGVEPWVEAPERSFTSLAQVIAQTRRT